MASLLVHVEIPGGNSYIHCFEAGFDSWHPATTLLIKKYSDDDTSLSCCQLYDLSSSNFRHELEKEAKKRVIFGFWILDFLGSLG